MERNWLLWREVLVPMARSLLSGGWLEQEQHFEFRDPIQMLQVMLYGFDIGWPIHTHTHTHHTER